MKKWMILTLLVLGMVTAVMAQDKEEKSLNLSQRLITLDGKTVALDQLMGQKGLVVIFWSNTCPWVAKYEQRTIKLAEEYTKKGFGFVLVNSNDPRQYEKESLEYMKSMAEKGKYSVPYVKDDFSALAVSLDAKRTPHVYVFDPSFRLKYQGAIDDNPEDASQVKEAYLKAVLDAMLTGKPVPYRETKAIGCTIKFYKTTD